MRFSLVLGFFAANTRVFGRGFEGFLFQERDVADVVGGVVV
jgi:hypothetical protein